MAKYITCIKASLNQSEEEDLQSQGFYKIDVNLNSPCAPSSNGVFIWYRTLPAGSPITRIQVSFEEGMSEGLTNAGYNKVYLGGQVFLWYFSGSTEFDKPIRSIDVSTSDKDEAEKVTLGMERVGHNLSRAKERRLYLWMERDVETYICDVTATNFFGSDLSKFREGYIRIDDPTNTLPMKNSTNFLWYRHTTDAKKALAHLKISNSTSDYKPQGYTCVEVNLNSGSGGKPVYLWYKKEASHPPVKSVLLLTSRCAIKPFEKAGINVIQQNINEGNDGPGYHLCFFNQQ